MILVLIYIIIQSKHVCGQSFFCTERKNVTIVPHIDIEHSRISVLWKYVENPVIQLRYFIKSLLETSCFEVWFHSPIQNRCIRQTEEIYVPFLYTEWMAMTSTDDNDIFNVLSNIPNTTDNIEQIILFVSFELTVNPEDASHFGTRLKEIRQKYNIIILCMLQMFSKLCRQGKKWLGNKRVLFNFYNDASFNPHIHRTMFDLVNNHQYDWRERYTREIENQCQVSKNTNIFTWNVFHPEETQSKFFVLFPRDVLNDFFINSTINVGETYTYLYYTMPFSDWNRKEPNFEGQRQIIKKYKT